MLFVLDENILIRAIARDEVEFSGGRYVRAGNPDRSALDLVAAIMGNAHRLAISVELWRRYAHHREQLQESGIVSDPNPLDVIAQAWVSRVRFIPNPPSVDLLDSFPRKDFYLARLALASGATLVTEDDGIHTAAAGGALGFAVLHIADALERARQPA